MPHFSNTAAAALAGERLRAAHLVEMDFTSGLERVWTGFGNLDSDGHTWQGLGRLGSVGQLDLAAGGGNAPMTLALSGLDPSFIGVAKDQEDEILGRRAVAYVQIFGENWGVLDPPYALFAGLMDRMVIKRTATTASIELTVDHVLAPKHRPPYGNWSHRDQLKRFPGDLSFIRGPRNVNRELAWP